MNRRQETLLHIAIWLVISLSPLMFINHGNGVSLMQFLYMSAAPLALMTVFYSNYLWLTPKYFVEGEKKFYFVINILLIVGLGIGLHYWMEHVHQLFNPRHWFRQLSQLQVVSFIIRDIFNLSIAAAIATTIQLAMRWQASERARTEAEAARTEAELRNLRSQINPHFLLNTLNNIYALTAFNTMQAQEAIQQLSKMMRHILYDNQQPTVPLNDEIDFLKNYISLMKIRLSSQVEVIFDIQKVMSNAPVAPMLFISLVENAFKHGISPTETSFIHIHIESDKQHICFEISNSNYPKTEQDRSGHGIGLDQVQRRLELAYPYRYTWNREVSDDGKIYHSEIQIQLS